MKQYLVKEWFKENEKKTLRVYILDENDLFHLLDEQGRLNKEEQKLIVVFEIGNCLIDWS